MTKPPGSRIRTSNTGPNWLQYAWNWVRHTDTNGWLEMPGSRTARAPDTRLYFANNPSATVTNGLGDEAAIRAVWAADTAQLDGKTQPAIDRTKAELIRPAWGEWSVPCACSLVD